MGFSFELTVRGFVSCCFTGSDSFSSIGGPPAPFDNNRSSLSGWLASSASLFPKPADFEDEETVIGRNLELEKEVLIDKAIIHKKCGNGFFLIIKLLVTFLFSEELTRALREAALKSKLDDIVQM